MLKEASKILRGLLPSEKKENYLRPPGAVEGKDFFILCDSCGECVNACPYQAIFMIGEEKRLPAIDPRRTPCYLCEDFPCIKSCSKGALSEGNFKMGTALLDKNRCIQYQGVFCINCFNRCPIRSIKLDNEGRPFITSQCLGCGVCEYVCPTNPPSIRVKPANSTFLP